MLPVTPIVTPINLKRVNASSPHKTAKRKVKSDPVLAKTVEEVRDVYAKEALYAQFATNHTGAIFKETLACCS
jgi:hypothetical protein